MFESEVSEFQEEVVGLVSFVCTSGAYTIKLHLLNILMEDVRSVLDISALYVSFYEYLKVHMKGHTNSCIGGQKRH